MRRRKSPAAVERAEIDRCEKVVEVAGPAGIRRNSDQKFKPPTIVRSKRQSVEESHMVVPNFWSVEVWQREKKETRDPKELKANQNTRSGPTKGSTLLAAKTCQA